ncbi:MFS transporter [Kineosporia succinea]|uniref:EmrB/QacA subfamily drug resistance transporter n=1 Tax=Kineosporia succinea TaxID=84632 RepID=A0ABT9P928_9ACTN|nr:MFS transporter [Kineosporia succinea]MDP9829206.1 EmrB/QacA subfamily drug resistance transporter [Kineosporia succinea]
MRKWTPLLAVCLGTFMLLIDVTIVNVALPDITRDLEASFSQVQWVIDIYALSLAALMLGAGGLADALGRRRIYLAGLTVFALASVACGLSQDITVLIIGRAVQGIGGAAMFATTVALINVSYSGRDRGTAYGIWGAVAGASAGVGSVIGGVLTDLLSWRWAFWVNLPVSVLAIALSIAVFADAERRRVRLDVPGMVTFTAAAGLITYAIIEAGESSWTSRTPVVSAVLGLLALAAFVLLERRAEHPLIDLTLLRSPVFTGAVLAAAVLSSAAFGSSALVSIWLQSVVGLSPLQTGLALLPMSVVAFAVAGFLSSRLHGVPVARPIGAGLFLIGCGSLLMLFVRAGSSWTALLAGLLVVGLGVGLATPPLTAAALSAVPVQRSGMASGVLNTSRQLGLAFGVAVLGSVFASRAASTLRDAGVPSADDVASAVAGGQTQVVLAKAPAAFHDQLRTAVHEAFASGLHGAFVIAGGVGVVGALVVFALLRRAPSEPDAPAPAAEPAVVRS